MSTTSQPTIIDELPIQDEYWIQWSTNPIYQRQGGFVKSLLGEDANHLPSNTTSSYSMPSRNQGKKTQRQLVTYPTLNIVLVGKMSNHRMIPCFDEPLSVTKRSDHRVSHGQIHMKIFDGDKLIGIHQLESVTFAPQCEDPEIFIASIQHQIFFNADEKDKHMEQLEMIPLGFSYHTDMIFKEVTITRTVGKDEEMEELIQMMKKNIMTNRSKDNAKILDEYSQTIKEMTGL
ncbi:MAG: hypothetical protein ACTSUE_09155 [Promethearchaeota archaeon]